MSSGGARPRRGPFAWVAARVRSQRFIVADESMRPSFLPGDHLLVRRADRRVPPRAGDVIVLRDPEREGLLLLKRVRSTAETESICRDAPSPRLVVVGDNALLSRDSRHFGPVETSRVVGTVWYRYAPPGRRGWMP